MKRSELAPGLKVAYRFPAWTSRSNRADEYGEAVIVDPDWEVPADRCFDGEKVSCGGRPGSRQILYRMPGFEVVLRADVDARQFVAWDKFARQQARNHFRAQGIDVWRGTPEVEVALVNLVTMTTDDGDTRFTAEDYKSGFGWETVWLRVTDDGRYVARRGDGSEVVDVDPTHVYGPSWVAMQRARRQQRERQAAEQARRTALIVDTAERLGIAKGAVSVGTASGYQRTGSGFVHTATVDDEVLLVLSPRALAGLIDRAMSDPEWADAVRGEGVLDALRW